MHPVLIDFGIVKIYSWGFMLAVAVIVALIGANCQTQLSD